MNYNFRILKIKGCTFKKSLSNQRSQFKQIYNQAFRYSWEGFSTEQQDTLRKMLAPLGTLYGDKWQDAFNAEILS